MVRSLGYSYEGEGVSWRIEIVTRHLPTLLIYFEVSGNVFVSRLLPNVKSGALPGFGCVCLLKKTVLCRTWHGPQMPCVAYDCVHVTRLFCRRKTRNLGIVFCVPVLFLSCSIETFVVLGLVWYKDDFVCLLTKRVYGCVHDLPCFVLDHSACVHVL